MGYEVIISPSAKSDTDEIFAYIIGELDNTSTASGDIHANSEEFYVSPIYDTLRADKYNNKHKNMEGLLIMQAKSAKNPISHFIHPPWRMR